MRDDWSTLRKLMFQHMAAGGSLKEYEAEGNPAVFQTNVAKPLARFSIPFLPVQSGTGDPSPSNVRPISGRQGLTAWRTGKNLFDENNPAPLQDCFNYQGNAQSRRGVKIETAPGTYTVFSNATPSGGYIYFNVLNKDGTLAYYNTIISNKDKNTRTFTVSEGQYIVIFDQQANAAGSEVRWKGAEIQLELGSTASSYAEYTGASYPVTFPALGENLLPPTVYNYAYLNDAIVEGTSYRGMYARIPSAGTYRISRESVTGNRFRFYASVEEPSPGVTVRKLAERDGQSWTTVDFPEGYNYLFIYLANDGSEITPSIMVSEGSTALPYEPYTNTVYGGTWDAVSGVLTVEWAVANLNSESAWGSYGTGDGFLVYVTKSDMQVGNRLPGYCDMFPSVYSATGANIRFGADDNVIRLYNINTFGITDLSEWKEFIGTSGINICYPLATPYEIQLDPITVQTLIGDNTIWTDTNGSNTIKYKKKG